MCVFVPWDGVRVLHTQVRYNYQEKPNVAVVTLEVGFGERSCERREDGSVGGEAIGRK